MRHGWMIERIDGGAEGHRTDLGAELGTTLLGASVVGAARAATAIHLALEAREVARREPDSSRRAMPPGCGAEASR